MTVIALPSHGRWAEDQRGEGRAVRVATHLEPALIVLSVWRAGTCVGTVRLSPQAAAELVAGLTDGLAYLAEAGISEPPGADDDQSLAQRVQALDRRLSELEARKV
jgi:hypothetical protein